jgi:DNA-binding transcriptional ArsR family regulator
MPDPDVFYAIAHPARRQLLDVLRQREQPVHELAARFASSRPATSQHLRVLLDAGLISERRAGRENLYRLTPEPLAIVGDWLSDYEQFWAERLTALRVMLNELEAGAAGTDRPSSA